ncbi:cryptochrome/photolyase family protein [Chryseobacterium salviniae]|uniref:Deoxyribodipyrimidine photo-lyase n=1 Tax=Chryseobacterium salviniae TaxID=3101750 RepID=A0ABU6HS54_9FLAO|nr:deoxyribodipyrimidine photo-lyase [Chryseobacterium sp. T9W2-O]MEC3875886.1 deoxyribodipyrimidine photo-lyase [Chryseobacterium sp. T9W2-O]
MPKKKNKINLFWFRRDLRLQDNRGLFHALQQDQKVLPVFIFDKEILDKLENKSDKRVDYFHQALKEMHEELKKHKSGITVFHEKPLDAFKKLTKEYEIDTVFCNTDYEPQAIKRDHDIEDFLKEHHINFKSFKDQVIFEKEEVMKNDGTPYTVYTPYSKKWKELLKKNKIESFKTDFSQFLSYEPSQFPELKDIGFKKTDLEMVHPALKKSIIHDYDKYRDFPGMDHTTHLGVALRFGTISVRKCVQFASEHNETWLNELIWREFFMQILYHFPKVVNHSFKEKYEKIEWRNNEKEFDLWCRGKTGYPIVDAGMRQLNETGFMHNRVRMVVASFLTKHLLIDWRWGEAYFAEKLLDYELSSNNGNWQWAAGCGCDAAPYFRVFNPSEQTKKFDKDQKYIKNWLTEEEINAEEIVEHASARKRALEVYAKAVKN